MRGHATINFYFGGWFSMSDVKNAAYALSIAVVFSTLILSFALVESSKNIGSLSLARAVQVAGSVPALQVQQVAAATPAPTAPPAQPPVAPDNLRPTVDLSKAFFKGSADAKVALLEYTDIQCPFCARHRTQSYPKIITDYVDSGKIKYYYKQFPLESIHPLAKKAGEGYYCAGEQGKPFEFLDKTFANQDALGVPDLKKYAKELGLDSSKFDSCLDGGSKAALMDADFQEGVANGVSGTPSFLVLKPNGDAERIVGAQPYTAFKAALDRALAG